MATNGLISTRGAQRRTISTTLVAAGALLLASAAVFVGWGAAPAARGATSVTSETPPRRGCFAEGSTVTARPFFSRRSRSHGPRSYDWPLRPFTRQHPVRGFFNDPRDGKNGSHSFHFGIDISAPDGTPVYSVEAAVVHKHARNVAVVSRSGRIFSYWHIIPAVRHLQRVPKHGLLGRIEEPWSHVHFAELIGGEYVNPLREGALGPYLDTTSPTVADSRFTVAGRPVASSRLRGRVDLIIEASDVTPLRVAAPWTDMPVTPVLLRWRILRGNRQVSRWTVGVDFRSRLLPASQFGRVYAPPSRKNAPPKTGLYCFYAAHRWDTTSLRNGEYLLQVQAVDTGGNSSMASVPFTIANVAS